MGAEIEITEGTLSRKAQALAFITDYILREGHSPAMGDIARGLGVGRTRAKNLVHQLAVDKMIERAPGAQRGISVPGLAQQQMIEQLRREGWTVDQDVKHAGRAYPCPQEHLPLVTIIAHIPDPVAGDDNAEPHA